MGNLADFIVLLRLEDDDDDDNEGIVQRMVMAWKMRSYRDGLRHIHTVAEEGVPRFERRQTRLLVIKIVLQLTIIAILLWLAWR
jgi:hypothetical protein